MAPRIAEKQLTQAHKGEDADDLQMDKLVDNVADKPARLALSKLPTPARARARAVTPVQPAATPTKSGPSAPSAQAVSAQQPGVKETSVRPMPDKDGYPVWLHVYDLGPVTKWALNSWTLEGAFHVGIEVLGVEFSFQAVASCTKEDDKTSGLTWHHPKAHPRHVYRESIWMGSSTLSIPEIGRLLEGLEKIWLARDYHCLRNNCTDFASTLTQGLKVPQPFPAWVHGIAKGFLKPAADADLVFFPNGVCSSWSGTSSGSISSAIKEKAEDPQQTEPTPKAATTNQIAQSDLSSSPTVEPTSEGAYKAPAGQRLLCGGTLCFMNN